MTMDHFGKAHGEGASARYEEYFVPAIGAPLAGHLVAEAALQPGECVLDAACGTGIVARFAAETVGPNGKVTGIDINPGMLAVARKAAPPEAPIDWCEGSLEEMPLPDDAFDAVLCQLSLQFVGDRIRALREMRRVLRDGGRVGVNVPGPASPLFAHLAEAIARHVNPQAGGFVRQVFALHDEEEIRTMLATAGFRDVIVEAREAELNLPPAREFLWQYVESTPLAGLTANLDEQARQALETEVVSRWNDFGADGGMRCPQRIVEAFGRN